MVCGLTTRQRKLFPGNKFSSDMEDLPEHHSQISHSKHIMTSLWRRQEHASQMTLEFYSHLTDCRQNVLHGFVVVPRPLVLRVAIGSFLGRWITGGVLRLSYMDYEVFLQLLSVDIMQFTLAEIKKILLMKKDEIFVYHQGRKKEKFRLQNRIWTHDRPDISWKFTIFHYLLQHDLRERRELLIMTKPLKQISGLSLYVLCFTRWLIKLTTPKCKVQRILQNLFKFPSSAWFFSVLALKTKSDFSHHSSSFKNCNRNHLKT